MDLRSALISALLAIATARTSEASRLDQSYVPDSSPILSSTVGDFGNGQKAEQAQTFRVGVEGRLAEVSVYLGWSDGPPSGLMLEIHRTTPDGRPSEAPSDLIGAAFLTPAPFLKGYQLVGFDLGQYAPEVKVGDQLAIVLKVPGAGSFNWGGSISDPYGEGHSFTRSSFYRDRWATPLPITNNDDLGFQTFVEPVPEPSSLAILCLSGTFLMAIRRRLVT